MGSAGVPYPFAAGFWSHAACCFSAFEALPRPRRNRQAVPPGRAAGRVGGDRGRGETEQVRTSGGIADGLRVPALIAESSGGDDAHGANGRSVAESRTGLAGSGPVARSRSTGLRTAHHRGVFPRTGN